MQHSAAAAAWIAAVVEASRKGTRLPLKTWSASSETTGRRYAVRNRALGEIEIPAYASQ